MLDAAPSGQPQEATRPDTLPERFWDAEKKAIKADELAAEYAGIAAWKAAEDGRLAQLPKDADAYPWELPADFKLPDGVEYSLAKDHPLMKSVKEWAHKNKVHPDAVKELIGSYAGREIAERQALATQAKAELGKLGATAEARINAVATFITTRYGAELAQELFPMMATAKQVMAFERIMADLTNGGMPSVKPASGNGQAPKTWAEMFGYGN